MPDENLKQDFKLARSAISQLAASQLKRTALAGIIGKMKVSPSLSGGLARPEAPPVVQPPAAATPTPVAALQGNPLASLPFPNPGDRIRADDFRALSQSLLVIRDAFALSGGLFGQTFAQARSVLAAGNYLIVEVMTVFGTIFENLDDPSLDSRKVIQVLPLNLGEPEVVVVLTEAVETRRFAPNLIGLTHKEASERLRNILGDITFPGVSRSAGQLVGLSLADAQKVLTESR